MSVVAKAIVERVGAMSQLKLHKLLYYCQVLSALWFDRALFANSIEAWANGPVVPEFWRDNRYVSWIDTSSIDDSTESLSQEDLSCIDAICKAYGSMSGDALSAQTHAEDPWKNARTGLKPGEIGSREITLEEIKQYYRTKWATRT